jgi:hypothetical protein
VTLTGFVLLIESNRMLSELLDSATSHHCLAAAASNLKYEVSHCCSLFYSLAEVLQQKHPARNFFGTMGCSCGGCVYRML